MVFYFIKTLYDLPVSINSYKQICVFEKNDIYKNVVFLILNSLDGCYPCKFCILLDKNKNQMEIFLAL